MKLRTSLHFAVWRAASTCAAALLLSRAPLAQVAEPPLNAVLISPEQASEVLTSGNDASVSIVVALGGPMEQAQTGARAIVEKRGGVSYWIEISRSPELADANPEWMASIQTHPEWRRLFPDFPQSREHEVVKTYPWVPMLYEESFEAHLARVEALLRELPRPKSIFLNGLQAAPSACGCGNLLCRWTPDYGPQQTAKRLANDAAANFVERVRKLASGAEIVPVWATECEEHEMAKDGNCAGVSCFSGTCWYQWTEQLMPLARSSQRIATLTPYRALGKDDPRYGEEASWVKNAIELFATMPPKRRGEAVAANRIIAVLQGWNVSPIEIEAQIARAKEAGAAGWIVSRMPIDQSWEPRIIELSGAPKVKNNAHAHPE